MTVISRYAYRAVWDASELTKGLMNSRALFQAQKKIVEESRTPFERLAIGQENLNKLIEKYPDLAKHKMRLELDLEKQYLRQEMALRKLTAAEKARMKELAKLVPDAPDSRNGNKDDKGSSLRRAAIVGAAAYAGQRAVRSTIGSSRDAVRQSDKIEAGFRTFTRDGEKAAEMMEQLRQKSRQTGVSFSTLAGGVEQLLVARFAPDESLDTMARLAEVAAGNTERMGRLATAMAQVRDMGRLQAEELNQLRDAGFNPLQEIMQQTGMSAADVKEQMRLGKISYELVALALKNATDEGGRFNGRLEEIAKTTEGAASRAAASMELAAERMGKAMGPALTAWEEMKAGIAEQSSQAIEETKWLPSFFASIQAGITQWRDPAKAAGILQKSWENSRLTPEEAASYSNGDDLLKSNRLDDQLAPIQKQLREREKAIQAARDAESKRAEMEAAAERARNAPTEKGQGYLKEQQQAILTLQQELTGEKDRQLSIEEKIFDLRRRMLADGANTQEIEKAMQLERQRENLQRQADHRKKREERMADLQSRASSAADKWSSKKEEERNITAMADLLLARNRGMISGADFDKASRDLVKVEPERGGSQLAPNIRANSQEAYQFLTGVGDRQSKDAERRHKEALALQKLLIAGQERLRLEIREMDSGPPAAR